MRRVRPGAVRVAHAVALAAATAALAFSLSGPRALLGPFLLPTAAVLALPLLEWTRVPEVFARLLPRAVALVLLAVVLLAWLSRSAGVLALDPTLVPRLAGPALLAAAVVSSLAPRTFSVGRALAPATIGLLAVAGLNPSPSGYAGTSLPVLHGGEHNAFAERYLALAVVAALALWAGVLLESGPRWTRRSLLGAASSLCVSAALAAALVAGLPLLQPYVETAVVSAFADASTGLSGESTLGEFARLAVSRRRVLDLQTDAGADRAWLLPSEVFVRFDGRRWTSPATATGAGGTAGRTRALRPLAAPPTTPATAGAGGLLTGIGNWFQLARPAAKGVALRVTQAEVGGWPLLLPRGMAVVTAPVDLIEIDRSSLLRWPPGQAPRLYGGLWPPATEPGAAAPGSQADEGADAVEPEGHERAIASDPPVDERAAALELPPRVDPRTAALAGRLGGSLDPAGRAAATVRHLREGYRYTLAPGEFHGTDPLAEFLFEKKAGYCEYFASAAVVLLRLQGVPARFVKGLSVGPHTDHGSGLHVVREADAHAWVEAWLPRRGWVEVDPTPPAQVAAARERPGAAARLSERLRAGIAALWSRLGTAGPAAFLGWVAAAVANSLEQAAGEPAAWAALVTALLGWLLLRTVRARRRRTASGPPDRALVAVPDELRAVVRELERRWAVAGRPRPLGRGLLEHSRAAAGEASAPPVTADLAAAGVAIVDAYYRARFGGLVPRPEDVRALRDRLGTGQRRPSRPEPSRRSGAGGRRCPESEPWNRNP